MVHKKILESLTAFVLDTAISKTFNKHQDDADYLPSYKSQIWRLS